MASRSQDEELDALADAASQTARLQAVAQDAVAARDAAQVTFRAQIISRIAPLRGQLRMNMIFDLRHLLDGRCPFSASALTCC